MTSAGSAAICGSPNGYALADFDSALGADAATAACAALDDLDVVVQGANGNVEIASIELILPDRVLRVHTGG